MRAIEGMWRRALIAVAISYSRGYESSSIRAYLT
jgi:hypothetical protein